MNRKLFCSIALSCLSLISTIWINIAIAKQYLRSDGKTQALFGIIELTYGCQDWVASLGIAALVLGVSSRHKSRLRLACILLSILSIMIVFVRLWRLFV